VDVLDLVAAVEAHAARRPDHLAVASARRSLSYRELATAAREQCLPAGGRRCLAASDAVDTAVAVLAAAMAGGALQVLDAAAPEPEAARARAQFGSGGDLPAGLGLTTSGVTGEPRCVVRPWALVAGNAAAFGQAMELTGDDVVLSTSGMHHSYAVSAGLSTALMAGAAFIAPGGVQSPKVLAGHIDRYRVTVLLSVPVLYRWYTAGLPVAAAPRLCVSAGAPLPGQTLQAWRERVGWPLAEHYGTSELGQITLARPGEEGTVGRPVAGVSVRAGRPNAAGERELEVCVDGPPAWLLQLTGGTVVATPLAGWCATGDVGEVDRAGLVHLHGRRGSVVNVAGKKVSLSEVEAALRALPGVRDCAVVADTVSGPLPKLSAFVEAGPEFTGQHAVARLRERLAPHKVPREVVTVPELPRTGSGKIRINALAQLAAARQPPAARGGPAAGDGVEWSAVQVPFAGSGSGVSPLTWGGQAIRRSIEWLGHEAHYFNDPHVIELPGGLATGAVTAALGALVSRHQALRAYYRRDGGEDVVRVLGAGTLEVIVAAPPEEGARACADRLAGEWGRALFTERDLPLRCAVVAPGGVPRFLVLVLSHQSIDGWAVDVLLSELRLLWGHRAGELPAHPWQLLDQVADEESGQSHARGETAARHWRAFYSAADPWLFDAPRRTPEPVAVHSVKMTSPATRAAAEMIAARLRVSTSAVLAGLTAIVLGQVTGHEQVTLLLIAGNRFDERRRQLVAPLAQDVLCRVEVSGDVDGIIRATARATLSAYASACYGPATELAIRREAELRRGVSFDFHGAIFNDVRERGRWEPGPGMLGGSPGAGADGWQAGGAGGGLDGAGGGAGPDLAGLRGLTSFCSGGQWERQNTTFFVRVLRPADTCRLELMADTHYLTTGDMRGVLAGFESVAVAAAPGPLPVAEVPVLAPVPGLRRDGGWLRHRHGWVDPAVLTSLLTGLPLCRSAAVLAGEGGDGLVTLTAYVHPDRPVTPAGLHRAVVEAMRDAPAGIAPDHYVICGSAPSDPASPQAWEACPVTAAGDGRPS
jgi:AMP-binding enzyme/condensation domain-containing protein